jgi:hypothetical protein
MEEPYVNPHTSDHPMKGQLEKIIEGYGEIKQTDMSAYLHVMDLIEEVVPDTIQPLNPKTTIEKKEDPSTKYLKDKLGIK